MDTFQALDTARRRHPHPPAAGSPEEARALDAFAAFFSSFAPDRIARLLPATYADDIWFNDTLKTVSGRDALAHYLSESAAAVEHCAVQIIDTTRNAEGEHLVRWRMTIRFKRFRRGVDTHSIGLSHLRFDAEGRVVYHQDYWNAAEGLFRHIPVLGWMIEAVLRRV
jgi:hypothetical protein